MTRKIPIEYEDENTGKKDHDNESGQPEGKPDMPDNNDKNESKATENMRQEDVKESPEQANAGVENAAEPEAAAPAIDPYRAALPDTAEELKNMLVAQKKSLEEAAQKSGEYLDHLQRLKAEFENYKKRTAREKQDTIKYANEQLLGRILGVLDNLNRGCEYAAEHAQDQEIVKGIQMVLRQIVDLLEEFGVKPFESKGKPFDPNYHEPLYTVESAEMEPNTVVEEVESGYMFHEKILRVAKVAVSREPAETGEKEE